MMGSSPASEIDAQARYVHIDNVVYHLDDIEVDKAGKCSWADVANALTHIKLCVESGFAQASASPVTEPDDLLEKLAGWPITSMVAQQAIDEITRLRGSAQEPGLAAYVDAELFAEVERRGIFLCDCEGRGSAQQQVCKNCGDPIGETFCGTCREMGCSVSSTEAPAAQQPREITDAMIEAGARELWNDRDARHGGPWDSRDPREVCVIQTKATMRAALKAALCASNPVSSTDSVQTYAEVCMNEKCPRGQGVPIEVVRSVSSYNPASGGK
ncbi:MAG TPA: hypothetical protein VIM11_26825 [Tepidisphaeraceae bacterium]|jgi:hypothetical protein